MCAVKVINNIVSLNHPLLKNKKYIYISACLCVCMLQVWTCGEC